MAAPTGADLSPREKEVLALFDQGLSYKEIADRLKISIHTVRAHARQVITKSLALSLRHAAYVRRARAATASAAGAAYSWLG